MSTQANDRTCIDKLAIRIQANPGLVALLLGSGISRTSGIPTGWEVTLDLVKRLAVSQGLDPAALEGHTEVENGQRVPAVARWYSQDFQGNETYTDPDYAEVLAYLFESPDEQQGALHAYFEASAEERERYGEGFKNPTRAHRAIARLVRLGFIRIVVTTNFDRLLETALHDEGVEPNVFTPEQISGMRPVHLYDHVILKLHGDYRQTRMKNSPADLDSYLTETNLVLDRIFTEYGLIVAGWSGSYDSALVRCLTSAKPRYKAVWLALSEPSSTAAEICSSIGAEVCIDPDGADSVFTSLSEKVVAIDDIIRPSPSTTEIAAATLKRLISGPEADPIRAHDLIWDEARKIRAEVISDLYPIRFSGEPKAEINERLSRLEDLSSILIILFATGCRWFTSEVEGALRESFEILSVARMDGSGSYNDALLQLRMYPALLCYYAGGISAISSRNGTALAALTSFRATRRDDKLPVFTWFCTWRVMEQSAQQAIEGRDREFTPLPNHLQELLAVKLGQLIPDPAGYQEAFDRFEYITSLMDSDLKVQQGRGPGSYVGAYGWRDSSWHDGVMRKRLAEEAESAGNDWWLLRSGLFGGSVDRFLEAMRTFNEWLGQHVHWH